MAGGEPDRMTRVTDALAQLDSICGRRAATDPHPVYLRKRPAASVGRERFIMSGNVCVVSESVGTSKTSVEDAIQGAIATTARKLDRFDVVETRRPVAGGKVAPDQVMLKVGFRYEA